MGILLQKRFIGFLVGFDGSIPESVLHEFRTEDVIVLQVDAQQGIIVGDVHLQAVLLLKRGPYLGI